MEHTPGFPAEQPAAAEAPPDDKNKKSSKRKRRAGGAEVRLPEQRQSPERQKSPKHEAAAEQLARSFDTLWHREAEPVPGEKQRRRPEIIEGEIPLNAETKELAEREISTRQVDVAQEISEVEPQSAEAAVAGADAAMLGRAQERLQDAETPAETVNQVMDEAYHATAGELTEATETENEALAQLQQLTPAAAEAVTGEGDDEAPTELTPSDTQSNPIFAGNPNIYSPATPDITPTPLAGSAGGGANQPPPPPTGGGPASPGGPNMNPNFYPGAQQPNVAAANTYNPNVVASPAAYQPEYDETGAAAAGAGLFGYLWGRRRGRKKAERAFKPIQQNLERQVKNIREVVSSKEVQIRALAAEQIRLRQQNQELHKEAIRANSQPVETLSQNQPEAGPQPTAAERLTAAATAVPLGAESHEKGSTETIASFVSALENQQLRVAAPPVETLPRRDIQHFNQQELKVLADRVVVEGTPVSRMFEAGLVTERGLRHVLQEFIAGRDIRPVLAAEIVQKQADFERDPRMRDRGTSATSGGGTSTTATPNPFTAFMQPRPTQAVVQPGHDSDQSKSEDLPTKQPKPNSEPMRPSNQAMGIGLGVLVVVAVILMLIALTR